MIATKVVGNGCIRHTSCLFRTGEAGFRHRISLPYRKRLFFTPNASENASRTTGGCFAHGTHIPYRRSLFLVPSPHEEANCCRCETSNFTKKPPLGSTSANILLPQRSLTYKKEADLLVDLSGDACRIQTYDLLIRSQMLYSAELRRQSHTGEPVLYYYSTSFRMPRLASLMRAFLPARARM